jgi:nitrilase
MASDFDTTCKVAVVQDASVVLDRNASVLKTVDLARQAAAQGAELVLFPEAFIPGYPRGLSFGAVVGSRSAEGRKLFRRYAENAVTVPGPQTDLLAQTAADLGIHLAVGVVEREAIKNGTLYCSLLLFDDEGELLNKHRKLKPTANERLIWGEGDGAGLVVMPTEIGNIGGLICWENYMPLARTALYSLGVELYLAPTADARESWQSTIRHIALEGRCFVFSCNQFVTKADYPNDLDAASRRELEALPDPVCSGGSAIVGPLGDYLAGPLWDESGILYASIDLGELAEARFDFDAVGHYSRPDLFQLTAPPGAGMAGMSHAQELALLGEALYNAGAVPGLLPPLDEEDLAELDEIFAQEDADHFDPFFPTFPAAWAEKPPGGIDLPRPTKLPAKPTKRRRRGK